jgi:hypothetical protein
VPAPVEPTLERLKGRLDKGKATLEPTPAAEDDDLAARLLARPKRQG